MEEFLQTKKGGSFLHAYIPMYSVLFLCAHLLEPTLPFLHLFTAGICINIWIYLIHRIFHSFYILCSQSTISTLQKISYLNFHVSIHHRKCLVLPKWLELTIESTQEVLMFFIFVTLQYITDIHIVPMSIILLVGFLYNSIHIINYSIYSSDIHNAHHINPDTNFGPDILDHVFGTNADETYEYMHHYIPNLILSYLLIQYIDGQSFIG